MSKLNVYKYGNKILAFATGVALAFTSPAAIKAKGEETTPVTIQTQSLMETESTMTMEQFIKIANNVKMELQAKGIANYENLDQDIRCTVALANIEKIHGTELERQLIDNGMIFDYDLTLVGHEGKNDYEQYNKDGWLTLTSSMRLINTILDYNQQKIGISKDTLTNEGLDQMINIEMFMSDNHDKEVATEIYNNLINLGKTMTDYSNEENRNFAITDAQEKCHTSLYSLNAGTDDYDLSSVSIGARWLNLKVNGNTHRMFMQQYMDSIASRKELSKYFNKQLLNNDTFRIRTDEAIEYDEISDPMLGLIVNNYAESETFVLLTVNNQLYKLLGQRCVTPEELNTKSR